MKGTYTFAVNHKGAVSIPFCKRSNLTPDQLVQAYLKGHGEFSTDADIRFEKHLREIRNERLHTIASFFNRRKNLPNLRIV